MMKALDDIRSRPLSITVVSCLVAAGACYWEADWRPAKSTLSSCGNGIIERAAGETCDGDCPESCDDLNACTIDVRQGSADTCSAVCHNDGVITNCRDGDGCCPTDCDATSDNDCSISCGNGTVETEQGETCDPPTDCPETCDDANPCTIDTLTGSAGNCNVECGHQEIVKCASGDGCCPTGCAGLDDDCSAFPPGPYGTEEGATIENFCLEECLCSGDALAGTRTLCVDDYLDAGATLMVATSGTCSACSLYTQTLEGTYYQPYHPRGLDALLVIYMDPQGASDRDALLDYCCRYREAQGISFSVAIDPGHWVLRHYHNNPPLTLLLDENLVISFKADGDIPSETTLTNKIEDLVVP